MRNFLYQLVIRDATHRCYQNCLCRIADNSQILDVGIGNGVMLQRFHKTIRDRGLRITGIDINRCYVDHCSSLIRSFGLENRVCIHQVPVEHYQPPRAKSFDVILFSMSFMLFAHQSMVLDRIKNWVKPGGRVLFFQTMFRDRNKWLEFIKPKLKYITTVDFGAVTYDQAFFSLLEKKQFTVLENHLVDRKWHKGDYRLITTAISDP